MKRLNKCKMETVHDYVKGLPEGTNLLAGVVAKRFNTNGNAAAGRFIMSSGHAVKEGKGRYTVHHII